MVKKVYKGLTDDQLERGVIFSSTLSTDRTDIQTDATVHEVLKDDPNKDAKMEHLLDDKFFTGSHYKFNVVRSLRDTNYKKSKKYWQ